MAMMRQLLIIVFALTGSLAASEPTTPTYPLCDSHESVADYAKRVKLPPTQTLDLGNGVKMELVLIPAGKFIMGTPEPTSVDEAVFHKQIAVGQTGVAVSAAALLIMLTIVSVRAIRRRSRPQLSLALLLLVTVVAGVCVLSGLHWRGSVRALENAKLEFAAAKMRYDATRQWEKPAHSVTLTHPYYMGKYDVTQEQYQQLIGTNPSAFKGKDNPVETVSWNDAQAFCKKLTERTSQTIRLATEAEWEYACRAGTTTMYYSGDTEADLARAGWYDTGILVTLNSTHPVGQKEPNAFGLYDMHGNVWQWCQDCSDADYPASPVEDPIAPEHKPEPYNPTGGRVVRGGSSFFPAKDCRSACRDGRIPDARIRNIGFRVVLVTTSRQTP